MSRRLVSCFFCNLDLKNKPENWQDLWQDHLNGHPDEMERPLTDLITPIEYLNDSSISNYALYQKQCEIINLLNKLLIPPTFDSKKYDI